ncbi:MAG: putative metalloprotease CJM1_0395 family protein [Hydrogenobaculum sp.]
MYVVGPNSKKYAVGGDVSIDVSPGPTPQDTIRKMERVIKAALAPVDPSAQDRAVAAQAQIELQKEDSNISVYA